jgi:hypothetical protein
MKLTEEDRNTRGNLLQCYFVHHKPHVDWPGMEPGPPRWEVCGCLSHVTAWKRKLHQREPCLRRFLCHFISLRLTIDRLRLCRIIYYRLSPYRAVKTSGQGFKLQSLNAVWETIAIYSEIHTKHLNKTELFYRLSPYRTKYTLRRFLKVSQLMLYGKQLIFITRSIQNM